MPTVPSGSMILVPLLANAVNSVWGVLGDLGEVGLGGATVAAGALVGAGGSVLVLPGVVVFCFFAAGCGAGAALVLAGSVLVAVFAFFAAGSAAALVGSRFCVGGCADASAVSAVLVVRRFF